MVWHMSILVIDSIIICIEYSQKDQESIYKGLNIMDSQMLVFLPLGYMEMKSGLMRCLMLFLIF